MAKSKKQTSLAKIPGTLVLVGAGKMGGAMLDGWLGLKLPPRKVVVIEPQPSKAIRALAKRGVRINPKGKIENVAALVIAVKPQVAPDAVPKLAALVGPKTVVVSIMAGRTLKFLEHALPNAAIVRAMPNTPAAIGRGITVAGSGELLQRSALEAATLRANVTSPGGTTAAALDVLMGADGLEPILNRAVAAATRRGRELGG